jgi:uncharacterized protein YcaQ
MKGEISKEQARRFLLTKQLLYSPKSLSGKKGIEEVFNTLRVVQYDPLNPCGRNPDLILQARVKNYHPNDYYDWLYTEKKGIECYDKELCIIPIEDFPLTGIERFAQQERRDKKLFLKKYEREIELLLQQIDKEGPISSSAIQNSTKIKSGWGTDALFGRMALETLWKMGRLVVVKRENGKKYYDLAYKVHESLKEDEILSSQITKNHVKRRLQSVGLLPLSGGGGGWQGLSAIKKIIQELVDEKEFIQVHVEGISHEYVIANSDKQLLMQNKKISNSKMTFIAPLDTLMWDRNMIHELFDFHYRWEVYTPVVKRQFGYYVLPILYGDQFVGRIEPVLDKNKNLVIKNLWFEKEWNKTIWTAYGKALESFKRYLRTDTVVYENSVNPLTH